MGQDRTALVRQHRRIGRLRERGIQRATVEVHDANRWVLDALRPLLRDPEKGHDLRDALRGLIRPPAPPPLSYVIETLRSLQQELERMGVEHVAVFGSVARGEAKDGSDIDVLVSFQPEQRGRMLALVKIGHELEAALGTFVDVVDRAGLKPGQHDGILREAVNVF